MAETTLNFQDFDLEMMRGETRTLDLTVTKIQGGTETAQDLTGGSLEILAKRTQRVADTAMVFRLHSGTDGGITITDDAAGAGTATIDGALTWELEQREVKLFLECVWINSAGKRHSFRSGQLTVKLGNRLTAPA